MLSILNKFRNFYSIKPEVITMPINTTKILQKAQHSWDNGRNDKNIDNKKQINDKFREILNKLSNVNYDFIKNELCEYINDNNFNNDIINIFYEKICYDHKFTELYIDILLGLNKKLKIDIIKILIDILNINFNDRIKYIYIDNDLIKNKLKVKIIGNIFLIVSLYKKNIIKIDYYFNSLCLLNDNIIINDFNIELLCILLNKSDYKNDTLLDTLKSVRNGNISKRNKFLIMDVEDNLQKYRKKN